MFTIPKFCSRLFAKRRCFWRLLSGFLDVSEGKEGFDVPRKGTKKFMRMFVEDGMKTE